MAAASTDPAVARACLAVGLGFACTMRGSSVQGVRLGDVSRLGDTLQVVEVGRKGHTHCDPIARSLSIGCAHLPACLVAPLPPLPISSSCLGRICLGGTITLLGFG